MSWCSVCYVWHMAWSKAWAMTQ